MPDSDACSRDAAPGTEQSFVIVLGGNSMRPVLESGDMVMVRKCKSRALRRGDVVAILDWSDPARPRYVVHRLLARVWFRGKIRLLTKGDNGLFPDAFSDEEMLKGRVAALRQDGRWHVFNGGGSGGAGIAWAFLSPILGGATFAAGAATRMFQFFMCQAGAGGSGLFMALAAGQEHLRAAYSRRRRSWIGYWLPELAPAERDCPAEPPAAMPWVGILDKDTEWAGDVTLCGDVVVSPGATLRIRAGARVRCRGDTMWHRRDSRPKSGLWAPTHPGDQCSLLVAGRLLVEGAPHQRVELGGGEAWGGVHFFGDSRGSLLAGLDVSGSRCGGINVWDRASVTIRQGHFERNYSGVSVWGRGRAALEDCEATDNFTGVEIDAGSLDWRGGRVRGGSVGLEVRGGARVGLERIQVRDCREHGLRVGAGRCAAESCGFSGSGDSGVLVERGGHAELTGCILENNQYGSSLVAGTASFERVVVRGSARTGVRLDKGFDLDWRDGAVEGGLVGLDIPAGSRAGLRGVAVKSAARHGAHVHGGQLQAADSRFQGNQDAGVMVESEGRLELEDCELQGNRFGVAAGASRTRLSRVRVYDCAEIAVSLTGGSHRFERLEVWGSPIRLCRAADARVECGDVEKGGAAAELYARVREPLRRLVLRTREYPGAGLLYRGAYAAGAWGIRLWAHMEPRVRAILLHRGWRQRLWSPGLSDLDWICVARDLSGEAGARWLKGFAARYKVMKNMLPFLGEPLIMEAEDIAFYLRWGGVRGRELRPELRAIPGVCAATAAEAARPATALEYLSECAHAYTSLMRWALWEERAPGEVVKYQARKAVLDLLRYGACAADPLKIPASRAELDARIGADAASPWPGLLRDMEAGSGSESARRGILSRVCVEALAYMDGVAARSPALEPACSEGPELRLPGASPDAGMSGAAREEGRMRMTRLEEVRARVGEALCGVCWDDLYRSYFILEDGGTGRPEQARMFEAIAALKKQADIPGTLPLVLSRSLWRTWQRLPYLESPAGMLAPAGQESGGWAVSSAGRMLPNHFQFRWGEGAAGLPPSGLRVSPAAGNWSLANLRFAWRFFGLGVSPLSAGYVAHYSFSRILGLRLLLERGRAAPFFELDVVLRMYREEFPAQSAVLEPLAAGRVTVHPRIFYDYYPWLDAQLRAAEQARCG